MWDSGRPPRPLFFQNSHIFPFFWGGASLRQTEWKLKTKSIFFQVQFKYCNSFKLSVLTFYIFCHLDVSDWLVILPDATGMFLIYPGSVLSWFLSLLSLYLPRLSAASMVQTSWPLGSSNGDAGLFTSSAQPVLGLLQCLVTQYSQPLACNLDCVASSQSLHCLALLWYQRRNCCKTECRCAV